MGRAGARLDAYAHHPAPALAGRDAVDRRLRAVHDDHDGDARAAPRRDAQGVRPADARLAHRARLPDEPARPHPRRHLGAAGAVGRRGAAPRLRGEPRRPPDPVPRPRRAAHRRLAERPRDDGGSREAVARARSRSRSSRSRGTVGATRLWGQVRPGTGAGATCSSGASASTWRSLGGGTTSSPRLLHANRAGRPQVRASASGIRRRDSRAPRSSSVAVHRGRPHALTGSVVGRRCVRRLRPRGPAAVEKRPQPLLALVARPALGDAAGGLGAVRAGRARGAWRAAPREGPAVASSPSTCAARRRGRRSTSWTRPDPERRLGVEPLARDEVASRRALADPAQRERRDDGRHDSELHLREREHRPAVGRSRRRCRRRVRCRPRARDRARPRRRARDSRRSPRTCDASRSRPRRWPRDRGRRRRASTRRPLPRRSSRRHPPARPPAPCRRRRTPPRARRSATRRTRCASRAARA